MHLAHAALASSLLFTLAQAKAGCDGGGLPAQVDGGIAAGLTWFMTCGDPVCREGGHRASGIAACTVQMVGAACDKAGDQCDPINDCNSLMRCAATDPTMQPGGCPISRGRFKRDVAYLDDAQKEALRQELLRIPLARYRYKADPAREHLGFIIDDLETPWPVAADGEHVDLYGYATMAAAALQAQEKEIQAMRREIEALRREIEALRAEMRVPAERPSKRASRR